VSINLKFAKRLRELRKESGLTQIELAEKSGVDYKYLQKLEGVPRGIDEARTHIQAQEQKASCYE
jgi:transcriptional regulator with XRE-family HTH domain